MIIGSLRKTKQLIIKEVADNEAATHLESYSELILSVFEVYNLVCSMYPDKVEYVDGQLIYQYDTDEDIYKKWKAIDHTHSTVNNQFIKTTKTYKSKISGTSILVRDPDKHIIRIALRKGNNTSQINKLCIDNNIREKFFADAKQSTYFKETGKYAIDSRDNLIYTHWSNYMNDEYIIQYAE